MAIGDAVEIWLLVSQIHFERMELSSQLACSGVVWDDDIFFPQYWDDFIDKDRLPNWLVILYV